MIIDAAELKRRYLLRIAGAHDRQVYVGPEVVDLEIINSCNIRCQFCLSHHSPGNPHHFEKTRLFSWEKFLNVVADCVELNVDEICFAGSGEPTLHPLFGQMMQHMEQQPIKLKLLTNATFPSDHCMDVIKGDHVVINLSAVDRQQYQDLQGKDLFDRVIHNIERLVSLRDSVKPGFIIELIYIVNTLNIDQKEQMQKLASRLDVNAVHFERMHTHSYNRKIALPQGPLSDLEGEKAQTPPVCLNGWFYTMAKLDGSSSTCCRIHHMQLGDLEKMSFKELWLSSKMRNMRLLGKYGHLQKMFKACQTCPLYEENMERQQASARLRENNQAIVG